MGMIFPIILMIFSSIIGGNIVASISGAYPAFLLLLVITIVQYDINYERMLFSLLQIMVIFTLVIVLLDVVGFINVNEDNFIRNAFYTYDMGVMVKSSSYAVYYKVFFKSSPFFKRLLKEKMRGKCMIGNKKTIANIIKVSTSNILKLLAGILVGFLLPKVIGVTDYGYYKTFTLYASYVGLFHFGLADGIYLKFGGVNYDDLNKEDFRYYCSFYILLESCVSVIIVVIAVLFMNEEYRFIFICEAVYLLAMNITNLYQLISQITNRFTELSLRNVINSGLTIVSLLVLWALRKFGVGSASYRTYTIMYVLIVLILAVWYISTYRDITFGKRSHNKSHEIWRFFKLGFPLMLSALCTSLILTLDRQFVSGLFDINTYAVYAFAYSMLNLVTVAISAISTVLYPTLKRADEKALSTSYTSLISMIQCLVCGCIVVYFPLCVFIEHFLPQYVGSLGIFRIIFPGIAISSSITIVMHNYYKTLGWTTLFFKKCVIILAISAFANMIAYVLFKTPASISVASIITLIMWYFVAQHNLIMKYKIKWIKNSAYILSSMLVFYIVTKIENYGISMIIYVLSYVFITFIFYKNVIIHFTKSFRRNRL